MAHNSPAKLTMGPVLFNWTPQVWRDFYFRLADEAAVDTVCVGEVTCSKRAPFFEPFLPDVVTRLQSAGKEVVLSTLALVMNRREMSALRDLCASEDFMIEANDISAAALLAGTPHAIGPFINTYNEGTLEYLTSHGAQRVCLPVELSAQALEILARNSSAQLEVQVFGRLPLAVSARCYHARSRNLSKDSCQYVCSQDPDAMEVATLDGEPFLAVNGTQTMSFKYANLLAEMGRMGDMGINRFRLWPHSIDMVAVIRIFRDFLDGAIDPSLAQERLGLLTDGVAFSNGYFYGQQGVSFIQP